MSLGRSTRHGCDMISINAGEFSSLVRTIKGDPVTLRRLREELRRKKLEGRSRKGVLTIAGDKLIRRVWEHLARRVAGHNGTRLGRPPSSEIAHRDEMIVQELEELKNSHPKRKREDIRSELAKKHRMSARNVKEIEARHRKKRGTDAQNPH